MIVGNVIGWDKGDDDIFNPHSHRNRDDCLEPYRKLNEVASSHGIELHTPDVNKNLGLSPSFNLFFESKDIQFPGRNYLIRFESDLIVPRNGDLTYLNQFDCVFTWDDSLVDQRKFIKFNYPNKLNFFEGYGFSCRPIFASMICGNKFLAKDDARDLYSERVKAIKWFEKNCIQDFQLYGLGWDRPARARSGFPKLLYKLNKLKSLVTRQPPFPSYRGPVTAKKDVLEKSRFSICYENVRDMPGYITEKIFDAFFSGCIPVYWGDSRVQNFIPEQCFIDRRNFKSMDDLYQFMKSMTETEYIEMQNSIRIFLESNLFDRFSSSNFALTIVSSILKYERQYENR